MVYSFALQIAGSESAEFIVDLWNQFGEGILVAITMTFQQQGYIDGGGSILRSGEIANAAFRGY
jgi:hypothetical protein